jgi:protein-tyrosine phosphatase
MYKILFVCMGNICRSPSAEGFFLHHLTNSRLRNVIETDSAGTHSYHIGHPPDTRAISEAKSFGVDISDLRARKVRITDFSDFDLILGMDHHNLGLIDNMKPMDSGAETGLMMEYDPEAGYEEVPDPYYGAQRDFRLMCELLDKATHKLLTRLEASDI